ncbi:MAG: hypothetical protein OHM77_02910 [Candidatus Nitricoxidivorans perseverans]|uniref:carbonic anhydrase n=1 Tax=Candidatus Nitricoxidivorans perseverans TaxID=2975601 RepID=A0AA49FM24_9PROT|nr:MAG: hypothetical protein OHM77_02910 [Candidatus Nitricoxidivorans perseverans]
MKDIANFIAGFQRFQEKYFGEDLELFGQLRQGQRPKAAIIACADSRVDPALLMGAAPGDVFVVRNVANLVPPYEPDGGFARVPAELQAKPPALQARACEQAAILVSLENLMTYPWIAERVAVGAMHLHGRYFDIAQGELPSYQPTRNAFEPIGASSSDQPVNRP